MILATFILYTSDHQAPDPSLNQTRDHIFVVKFHLRNYQGLVNVFFILNDPLLTSELITYMLTVSSTLISTTNARLLFTVDYNKQLEMRQTDSQTATFVLYTSDPSTRP